VPERREEFSVRTYQLVLAVFFAAAAAAEERLSLDALVAEALEKNPEIMAAQKRYEAARQQSRVEGALPDPMVGIGWNSSGGPLPFQGVGREPVANVGVMVTQQIPYPGKRNLRERMASREADADLQTYRAARLAVASRVKQAYFRLQHTWEMQEVLERTRELTRRLLGIAEIRYGVGKAMQAEVLRTQTQLSTLEARLMQFARERRAREAEINALLNRPAAAPLPQPVEPHAEPLRHTVEELIARAGDESPMLRRDEKMIQRSELALAMARREYYPDLAVTGGYYYMGSMPSMYMFRLDVNVPVWWSRKQKPGVNAEAGRLAQSRRNWQAATRNLEFRIKDDYLMAQTALDLMKLYRETVIPQATLTFESALSSYETGTGGFNEVLMNAMAATEYEMNWHEEMQNYHLALARLEEMTGADLIHPRSTP
jgi:outer membrane protein TolC